MISTIKIVADCGGHKIHFGVLLSDLVGMCLGAALLGSARLGLGLIGSYRLASPAPALAPRPSPTRPALPRIAYMMAPLRLAH